MIGFIQGILIHKQPPTLMINVNGLGYEVEASMNTFYHLPELNQQVKLFTHFVVREDAQLLYGFFDQEERSLFRTLIKVNGVGPKLAITILSSITAMEFARHVLDNNITALTKLPGVGKKTAERLLVEMRDKFKGKDMILNGKKLKNSLSQFTIEQEAMSALITLGFKPQEASKVIAQIEKENLSSEELIRLALKKLV